MPKTCPICNVVFAGWRSTNQEMYKYCRNCKVIEFFYKEVDKNVIQIRLITSFLYVIWKCLFKQVTIINREKLSRANIPYFEPDFSDMNKLIKKINTYILLS